MNGNLLIIDDEEYLVDNIKFLLKGYAENIFVAYNGYSGLDILRKENIHCVICDISMPKMNGVQVIEKARQEGFETPFIFYTALGSSDLMREVAKFGAFDFLTKPDFDNLEEVVSRGLREGFNRDIRHSTSASTAEYDAILNEFLKKNQ